MTDVTDTQGYSQSELGCVHEQEDVLDWSDKNQPTDLKFRASQTLQDVNVSSFLFLFGGSL